MIKAEMKVGKGKLLINVKFQQILNESFRRKLTSDNTFLFWFEVRTDKIELKFWREWNFAVRIWVVVVEFVSKHFTALNKNFGKF